MTSFRCFSPLIRLPTPLIDKEQMIEQKRASFTIAGAYVAHMFYFCRYDVAVTFRRYAADCLSSLPPDAGEPRRRVRRRGHAC